MPLQDIEPRIEAHRYPISAQDIAFLSNLDSLTSRVNRIKPLIGSSRTVKRRSNGYDILAFAFSFLVYSLTLEMETYSSESSLKYSQLHGEATQKSLYSLQAPLQATLRK